MASSSVLLYITEQAHRWQAGTKFLVVVNQASTETPKMTTESPQMMQTNQIKPKQPQRDAKWPPRNAEMPNNRRKAHYNREQMQNSHKRDNKKKHT